MRPNLVSSQRLSSRCICLFVWLLCVMSCAVVAPLAYGQGGGTSGGSTNTPSRGGSAGVTHTVRGKIFLPSGALPEQRIRVVLEMSTGGIVSEAFSDSVGNFEFRGLSNGTYRISVPSDRESYETTQETVELYGSFGRTFTAQIYLREKNSDIRAISKEKILSAADIQEIPKAAKKSYEQGLKLARNNRPADAVPKLQDALKVFPDYLYALNKLGEQYLALNQLPEAQAQFERAIAINSKFALPHINLGILHLGQKRFTEALAELEVGNAQDDSYPMGHLHLGLALMSKTPPDFDRAEKELLRSIDQGKQDFIYVRKYLFNLNLRRQNLGKAAEQLELYLRAMPEAPDSDAVRQMLAKVKKTISQQKQQSPQQ